MLWPRGRGPKSPLLATAMLRTQSKSDGSPVKSPVARSTVWHRIPAFSRPSQDVTSLKRAMPHTSLPAARARAMGAADLAGRTGDQDLRAAHWRPSSQVTASGLVNWVAYALIATVRSGRGGWLRLR